MARNKFEAGTSLALAGPEGLLIIQSGDIAHAGRDGNVAAVVLLDGTVLKSYDSFDDLKKTLLKTGAFLQVQRSMIANVHNIKDARACRAI